jgi:hypothetical protein
MRVLKSVDRHLTWLGGDAAGKSVHQLHGLTEDVVAPAVGASNAALFEAPASIGVERPC